MGDFFEERRNARLKRELELAQEILNDPNADQLARDLAHLRLQPENNEGTKGFVSIVENSVPSFKDIPQEWLVAEAYEIGLVDLLDQEIVVLVEDPLLRNKCTTLRAVRGPDGRPSLLLAYPKLVQAVERQLTDRENRQQVASANAVMACLVRAGDNAGSLKYFNLAIRIRPDDWRLRNAIASSYMALDKVSMALEALTQAVELTTENSLERFHVESCRGKVLFNLGRHEEAKASFLSVLVSAEKYKEMLSPLDAGHLVPIEYMLCCIWAMEKNKKMCRHQWGSAEAKRNALTTEVRQRLDWDSRQLAQQLMGGLDPNLLSHQECHNCRKLCSDLLRCAGCKVALYCSRECQIAAWRAGHKGECKKAKQDRKVDKKEKKVAEKKREAVSNLPPLDATLEPFALWAKAKKLSREAKKAEDAVFYFTVALFLDFSLDAQDKEPAKAAVEACEMKHPLSLALRMITHMDRRDPLGHIETLLDKARAYLESHDCGESLEYDTSESVEQVNRVRFGMAMCTIFCARIMARCFAVQSFQQAQSAAHKQAFDSISALIREVQIYLPTDRWLTIQFELGYSNLDVGAAAEAKRWLELFVQNLEALERANGKLTKHWKQMRKNARAKLQMVQVMQVAQRSGIMP